MQTVTEAKPKMKPASVGVRRSGLYTAIADRLRDMIQEGELSPGSRIMEKEVCDYFEISKTPLREALKVLVAEGLITHRQHLGYHVAPIDLDEIEAAFEVLHGLEEIAGRHLAERVDDESLAAIERKHQLMQSHHRNGKRTAYYRLNQEIHQMIVDAARNPVLSAVYANLMTKIHRARGVVNADTLRWNESLTEHGEIFAAMCNRDREVLPRLLREHSEHTGREVMKVLRHLPSA
jgi:DNA-binding GntR family transcriptional regulator